MAELTIRNPVGDYRDGGEAELLRIVGGASDRRTGSLELLGAVHDWVTRYHLSSLRPNVLAPLELRPGSRVLEIGAGTGVLTRWLADQGHRVTAVEGALARAEVIAARCAGLDDVQVVCGGPDDVPEDEEFDAVLLIGVLEYSGVGGLPSADHLLDRCARALAEDGVLVVAIENQLGIQYLAGALEDHRALAGVGVEGYVRPGARTWDRRTLGAMVAGHGLAAQRWLYPFPDYKVPSAVLADRAFEVADAATVTALARRFRGSESGEGPLTFDLVAAYEVAAAAGIAPDLANSFVLVAGRDDATVAAIGDPGPVAWLFGDERHPRWARRREVRVSGAGDGLEVVAVGGEPERTEAWLTQRVPPRRPFAPGETIADQARAACRRRDGEALDDALGRWRAALDAVALDDDAVPAGEHPFRSPEGVAAALLPADHVDVDLGNFVVAPDGTSTYIDDEWVADGPLDRDLVALRALRSFAAGLIGEGCAFPGTPDDTVDDLALVLAARAGLAVDASTLERVVAAERALQQLVLVATDETIDHWLDGSASVAGGTEVGLPATRAGEAWRDAEAEVHALKLELHAVRAQHAWLEGQLQAAVAERDKLHRDWFIMKAQITTLEELLDRARSATS